ncbi:MAG TPA: O-antigen ligase family protein [Planctomycetota bacterium]|nr:O-antigen ligase family protein [Planctomycetota bacterium]
MRRLSVVLFGLVLACPLSGLAGPEFDAFRLPLVLALAGAVLGTAFLRASRSADKPPGPAPLRTAGLILLAVQVLSLAVARNVADAAAPLLTLAAGVLVFSCMRGGMLRKEPALTLLPVIPATGLIVAGLGLLQFALGKEAVSTEGNRNYAGALAAMLLPPSVAFLRRGPAWSRWLSGAAGAALIGLLLISESRGGFLAALAGLALAGTAMGLRKVPGGLPAAGVAAVALIGLALGFQGARQMSEQRMETAAFRLEVWKSGWEMLKQRPVLGWGAGSFQREYPPFRSEAEFRNSHKYVPEGFKEVEDPHSTWVAAAVETGIPGLLALLLVVYVAARLWRFYVRRSEDTDVSAALAGLGGGALAYLVAGVFNTLSLHVSPTLLFWCFLGLIEAVGETRPWRPSTKTRETRAAIPAAAAIAMLFATFWTLKVAQAEHLFLEGMTTSDPSLRAALLRESVEEYPQGWRAHYELARTLPALGRFPGAADEARATLALRPHHVEALNQAAVCIAQSGGDTYEAERHLRRAMQLAPWYYKSFYNIGLLEARRGHSGESRCYLSKSVERKPDHALSYYCRGAAFLGEGESEDAVKDFRKARDLGFDVAAALRAERPQAVNDSRLSEFFR